jgi:adenylate cyclase
MPAAARPRRLLGAESPEGNEVGFMAILITDIVGSTDVSVALGDIAYHRLVTEHHRLVREQLERFGGHEFSEGGDSLLAWFDDANAAIGSAMAIQDEAERGAQNQSGLSIRIGLAGGHPLVVEGRPYGSVVNLAARVTSSAGSGEVVAEDSLVRRCRWPSLERRELSFKGFPYVHSVHRLRAGMYPMSGPPLLGHGDGPETRESSWV